MARFDYELYLRWSQVCRWCSLRFTIDYDRCPRCNVKVR